VRSLVKAGWRRELETELKWLADLLGSVRDLDILIGRLREASDGDAAVRSAGGNPRIGPLPPAPLGPMVSELRVRHRLHSERLREALRSARYRRLFDLIGSSIEEPALRKRASRPCHDMLPPLAVEAWETLRDAARKLSPSDPDADFHEVRKLAKRARYTAELIGPVLGRSDRRAESVTEYIRLTTRLQDVLGEHQDATVALVELERFASEQPSKGPTARAARDVIRQQRRASRRARKAFFEVWPGLDRKASLRWLKPCS
jgi:CHAD domain-containing protein